MDHSPAQINSIVTDRGYTGHEMLDEVALIHMNGRIYDPLLARFMVADPNVTVPTSLQAYNRYSYVYNNPLGYVDPTGYWPGWLEEHGVTPQLVAGIAVAAFLGPDDTVFFSSGGITGNAFVSTLVAGAESGAVISGNLQGAFQGAISAALFYGAGSNGLVTDNTGIWAAGGVGRSLLNAAAGCISGAISGAGCGSQALAAGLGEYIGANYLDTSNHYLNIAERAVLGGTASAISGGDFVNGFANGAETGAFQYLFDDGVPYPTKSSPCNDGGGQMCHPSFVSPSSEDARLAAYITLAAMGLILPGGEIIDGILIENAAEGGMAGIRALGLAGEDAVGIAGNTQRIASATDTAAYRIPDIFDPASQVIGEVKNVGSLSYTNQLRDFSAFASENPGWTFQLYVRPTTQLSGPLQQAIGNGDIVLRFIP